MADRIERVVLLPASTAEVWATLTNPELLEAWLADEVELELRPGGDARFGSGEAERTGWIEEVSAPSRLAFWWSQGDEPASRVEITLTELDQRSTRLRVVETRPLELLDLVGIPLPGQGGASYGPALVAAAR
jgi:uncharacterized protein YndB with AHSA1/START domain